MSSLIGGGMPVLGGENGDQIKSAQQKQMQMLVSGQGYVEIYLNGGSEERREVKDYWQELARRIGVPVECSGHMITVGVKGASC